MVPCLLFRLPQEIRDQIYLYALYKEDGIYYETCRDGMNRLCREPRALSLQNTIARWFYRCSLRRKRSGHTRENNQLKYVCKRLYSETKELDILYNLVVFKDATKTDALERCTFLLTRCLALREVAIRCSIQTFQNNYVKQEFSTMVRHCRTHFNVLVRIHIPYWSQADPNFVLTGLHFLSTLRADSLPVAQFARSILISYRPDSHPIHAEIPSNIRIFPNEDRFCYYTFVRNCRANPAIKLPVEPVNLIEVIKRVEGWFEHGL
jgi:hypothetical protein